MLEINDYLLATGWSFDRLIDQAPKERSHHYAHATLGRLRVDHYHTFGRFHFVHTPNPVRAGIHFEAFATLKDHLAKN